MDTFTNVVRAPWIALKRFFYEFTYHTSALAYTTLLAIVPLLFVIFFLLSVFPFFMDLFGLGEKYILKYFIPQTASVMGPYLQTFLHQATSLPALSILFLFVTSILLVNTIEETLNAIWQVPNRKHGKKILVVLIYWALFLLTPLIIGLSVLLSSYVFLLTWLVDAAVKSSLSIALLVILPIIINMILFGTIFVLVPNVKVEWRDGLIGGLVAAVLFEIARITFAYYIQQFPSYAVIYGAFAIIPIFLLWLYIFWFIIIFAALFAHTWAKLRNHPKHKKK